MSTLKTLFSTTLSSAAAILTYCVRSSIIINLWLLLIFTIALSMFWASNNIENKLFYWNLTQSKNGSLCLLLFN